MGSKLRAQVAEENARRVDDAQAAEGVAGPERVIEEPTGVVDAREPRHGEKPLAEQLVPHRLDVRHLREEAVPAEIEAIALELDRLGNAAHRALGLDHRRRAVAKGEDVRRRQPRRAGAQDRGPQVICGPSLSHRGPV
jgi:hypothetical protein